MPASIPCPYCRGEAVFSASSADVYHGRDYGPIYICRPCGAFCGCHKGTENPLGSPASKELRQMRRRAHSMFDAIWQEKLRRRRIERGADYPKGRARGSAYKWLREQMGMTPQECHIGMMGPEQVARVLEIVEPHFNRLGLSPSRSA